MNVEKATTSDVGAKITDFAAEVAALLDKPGVDDIPLAEALQRTEQWCYEATDEALDHLQRKLHEQHESVTDIKALWGAVSGARAKILEAQQLVEESLATLSDVSDDESLAGLLRGIELLDSHLRGDSEKLAIEAEVAGYLSNHYPDFQADRELTMAEDLLSIMGDVSSPDTDLLEKLGVLSDLCGKAGEITDELERLKPDFGEMNEESLKTMGLICSHLESSEPTLSEAALATRLLAHLYEIEQIEEKIHAVRSRHQMWGKQIAALRNELEFHQEQDGQKQFIEHIDAELKSLPEQPVQVAVCPKCGSDRITRKGSRNDKQRYRCGDCKSRFTM
jgi:predicted RNA-binding Zn-ribbon protein involved in translation (DUF1610 family)